MLYIIIPLFLLYLLWLFCVHMDEKELSNRQTRVMPQKELQERSEPEQNKPDKGVLTVRDFYYRFHRSEEPEQNLEKKRKPEEPPHDHQEDQQQKPPPALRERRGPLSRPREDEEEEGDDERVLPNAPTAPEPVNSVLVEKGTHEEWRHDEDFQDVVYTQKDAQTQTTPALKDKGLQAHSDQQDEELQCDRQEVLPAFSINQSLDLDNILPQSKSLPRARMRSDDIVHRNPVWSSWINNIIDEVESSLEDSPVRRRSNKEREDIAASIPSLPMSREFRLQLSQEELGSSFPLSSRLQRSQEALEECMREIVIRPPHVTRSSRIGMGSISSYDPEDMV